MIDGALLLDKPVGISSNRALQEAKKLYRASKAGHAGTLDPFATGLLLLLSGEATKLASCFVGLDKRYLTDVDLRSRTTTGDTEGEALDEHEAPDEEGLDVDHELASEKCLQRLSARS